jgi:hypothetical protein
VFPTTKFIQKGSTGENSRSTRKHPRIRHCPCRRLAGRSRCRPQRGRRDGLHICVDLDDHYQPIRVDFDIDPVIDGHPDANLQLVVLRVIGGNRDIRWIHG